MNMKSFSQSATAGTREALTLRALDARNLDRVLGGTAVSDLAKLVPDSPLDIANALGYGLTREQILEIASAGHSVAFVALAARRIAGSAA